MYLGATLCKDCTCSAEVRIRISSATAVMARLNRIWRCSTISFASVFKLHESLVTSIPFYGCKTWTLLPDSAKRIQAFDTKSLRNFSASPTWSARPSTGCGERSTFLWVNRDLFWQLPRDGNLHFSGVSHATTASPKPFFMAPWRVRDAEVGGGNAGWTISNIPTHARTVYNDLLQKRLEEDLC